MCTFWRSARTRLKWRRVSSFWSVGRGVRRKVVKEGGLERIRRVEV